LITKISPENRLSYFRFAALAMMKYQTAEIPSTLADIAEKVQNSPQKTSQA
jgi:hypothetical protein